MSLHPSFAKALDSQFQRLGQAASYVSCNGDSTDVLVMARRPEQLFDLGQSNIHAEQPELALRVSEQFVPQRGDCITIDTCVYRIAAEPRLDLHQLLWFVACLREGHYVEPAN